MKRSLCYGNSKESKLEKALEVLSVIDLDTFKPSDASVQKLKKDILNEDAGNRWCLKDRVFSLKSDDGFSFGDAYESS